MQNKIDNVIQLKSEKESAITTKILLKSNAKVPSASNLHTYKKISMAEINKADILKDLQFYHTERLKSIYELRKELNFTSIQSIADEINSLKLLNPAKADELFSLHSKFLKKSEFFTSTIFNDRASNVINADGIVKINKVELGGTSNRGNDVLLGNISHIEGIAANNGLYAIVYHADTRVYQDGTTGGFFYLGSTQLFSFVNFGGGFVLQPSYYFVNAQPPLLPSQIYFNGSLPNSPVAWRLAFPVYGSNTPYSNNSGYSITCYSITINKSQNSMTVTSGFIDGTYATLLGGQFLFLSGTATF
jgi:hypothetical protein